MGRPKRTQYIAFQPLIFRGYVSFREGIFLLTGLSSYGDADAAGMFEELEV